MNFTLHSKLYRFCFGQYLCSQSSAVFKQSGVEQWVQGVKEGNKNLPVDKINAEKQNEYYETLYNSLAQRVNWNIADDISSMNAVNLENNSWTYKIKSGNTLSQILSKFFTEHGTNIKNKKGLTYLAVSYLGYGSDRVNVDYIKPGYNVIIYKEENRLAIKITDGKGEVFQQQVGDTEVGFDQWLLPKEDELPQPNASTTAQPVESKKELAIEDQSGYKSLIKLSSQLSQISGVETTGRIIVAEAESKDKTTLNYANLIFKVKDRWFLAYKTADSTKSSFTVWEIDSPTNPDNPQDSDFNVQSVKKGTQEKEYANFNAMKRSFLTDFKIANQTSPSKPSPKPITKPKPNTEATKNSASQELQNDFPEIYNAINDKIGSQKANLKGKKVDTVSLTYQPGPNRTVIAVQSGGRDLISDIIYVTGDATSKEPNRIKELVKKSVNEMLK